MKPARMITDCAMIILLPLLMSYSLIGESLHEWLGLAMFAAFILHHILNLKWFTTLFKGKYSLYRVYTTVIDVLLFIVMFALPVSGMLMSGHAVPFLSIESGASTARTVHMTTAYWGFVIMSLHLGTHSEMMFALPRKALGLKRKSTTRRIILTAAALAVAGYGIYAFGKRGIGDYLLMKVRFAFFDPSESKLAFFADYISVMLLFAIASHYLSKLLKFLRKK